LGAIGWWSGDLGSGMSCLWQILPVTGSSTGTTMVISGKKCAKYAARFAQSDAIPWSTKLATPKKTASNKRALSNITVATFTGVSSKELQARRILKLSPCLNLSWPFCWLDRHRGDS